MSGGSFNYLYCKDLVPDTTDLHSMLDKLIEVCEGRKEYPRTRCVSDTLSILDKIKEIENLQQKLSDVWHAVEWWKSNDYSKIQAMEAIVKYEQDNSKNDLSDQG